MLPDHRGAGDRRRLAEPVSSGIIRWGIAAFLYCKSTGKRDKVSDCRRDQYHAGSHHAEPDLEFSAGRSKKAGNRVDRGIS